MALMGPRGLVVTALIAFVVGPAAAWAGAAPSKTASNVRPDINPALKQKLEKHIVEQSRGRANERNDVVGVGVFRDQKTGIPTFTNRIAKYRSKSGFVELDIRYEAIRVDRTYREMRAKNSYNVAGISHIVEEYATKWNLEPNLVYAVIRAESNFRQDAISPAGARGLMQLMPGTAEEMGVSDPFDPAENIAGGTQYLAKMLELFDDDVDLALAAYNAGPQTVINCGKQVPNISETKNYVKSVKRYKALFDGHQEAPTYVAAAKKPRLQELPKTDGKLKTIYYQSGLTQPVEKVIDEHPDYYYVQFKGRMWSVPKKFVKEIV